MSEADLITAVLEHPAGFDLNMFATLGVRSAFEGDKVVYLVYKEGQYVPPDYKTLDRGWEEDFPTAREAAERFVQKRHEMQLGIDIEAALHKQSQT